MDMINTVFFGFIYSFKFFGHLRNEKRHPSKYDPINPRIVIIDKDISLKPIKNNANKDKKAIELAQKLRSVDRSVTMFYGKPSKALEYANSYKIEKVVFVGAQEIKTKKFKIKDMFW